MVKFITTLSLILVGLLAKAQATETREVASFSKIEIGNNIELIYSETGTPSIKVVAQDDEQLANLITEIKGETLKIYMKNGKKNNAEDLKIVYVNGYNANSFVATSGAKITLKKHLSPPEIAITLKSGSSFLGVIKSDNKVTLEAEEGTVFNGRVETTAFYGYYSGNAKVNVSGSAKKAIIKSSNRSLCLAKNFKADQWDIKADDYATVKVYAKGSINIDVAELAKVTYSGNPERVRMNDNAVAINSDSLIYNGTLAAN